MNKHIAGLIKETDDSELRKLLLALVEALTGESDISKRRLLAAYTPNRLGFPARQNSRSLISSFIHLYVFLMLCKLLI